MYTRTEHGLANERLFHDVDLVVYCEGHAFCGEGATLDEAFWNKIFSVNGKSVTCKSYGCKKDLCNLASRIIDQEIEGVVVAMDRDYDHLRGSLIRHRNVVYTYGYSWENDAILEMNFQTVMSAFATVENATALRLEFDSFVYSQSAFLRRVFALDFKYIDHPEQLFDRGRPQSIVAVSREHLPFLKREYLLKRAIALGCFQSHRLSRSDYMSANGVRCFHGKSIARLFYHWFVFRSKKVFKSRSIPYEAFLSIVISGLEIGKRGGEIDQYYANAVKTI